MKISKNFYLEEFIDPETYKQYQEKSIWFIDGRLIEIVQKLRDRLGVVLYVNTWHHEGGSFSHSGFRPPSCQVGASKSQHKFGRAVDIKTGDFSSNGADIIRDEIKSNWHTYNSMGLTTIEDAIFAPTWCHLDIRYTKLKTLLIVKP